MDNNYNQQNQQYQQPQPYQQQPYQQPQQYQQFQQPYNQGGYDPTLENKANQAMVFGIIGIFIAGIIFGILALVNANACKKVGFTNGKVTAGFVLGILDIIFAVISSIVMRAMLNSLLG